MRSTFYALADKTRARLFADEAYLQPRQAIIESLHAHRLFGSMIDFDAPLCTMCTLEPFVATRGSARHFSRAAFIQSVDILRLAPRHTLSALITLGHHLDLALSSWLEMRVDHASLPDHELDDAAKTLKIASSWHSTYQHVIEHCWSHLAQYMVYVLHLNKTRGQRRNWKTDHANALYGVLEQKGLHHLVHGYSKTLRNALEQGTMTHDESTITYLDARGKESLSPRQFATNTLALHDTVSGMIAAVLTFLNQEHALISESESLHALPSSLRTLLVHATASREGFSVNEMRSHRTGPHTEAVITCTSTSRNKRSNHHDGLKVAVAALELFSENMDRMLIQIHVGKKMQHTITHQRSDLIALRDGVA